MYPIEGSGVSTGNSDFPASDFKYGTFSQNSACGGLNLFSIYPTKVQAFTYASLKLIIRITYTRTYKNSKTYPYLFQVCDTVKTGSTMSVVRVGGHSGVTKDSGCRWFPSNGWRPMHHMFRKRLFWKLSFFLPSGQYIFSDFSRRYFLKVFWWN